MSTYVVDGKPLEFDDAPEWLVAYMRYRLTVLNNTRTAVMTNFKDLREFFKWASLFKKVGRHPKNADSLRNICILELPLDVALQIKKNDIETYLYFATDVLRNEAATRNKKLASIRGFYDYLLDQQDSLGITLEANPADRIRRPKLPKKQPVYLTDSEQEKLLGAIGVEGANAVRDYAIYLLLLTTGIRVSEACRISLKDLSLEGMTIRIWGKGNKERTAHLTPPCCQAIKKYIEDYRSAITGLDTDILFVSKKKKTGLTCRAVEKNMEKYVLKAGLSNQGFTPHKLRHTTATVLSRAGVDLGTVQEILGHANANTTKIYTHLGGEDIARAVGTSRLSQLGTAPDYSDTEE